MKKILLFLIICLLSLSSYANTYKKFDKILQKCDVIQLLPEESDGDVLTFWNYVVFENKEFLNLFNKIKNKGGSAKSARTEIANSIQENASILSHYSFIISFIDSMKYTILGYNSFVDSLSIRIIDDESENAFCTPEINVYVYRGLADVIFNKSDNPRFCMYAVLAHEFTHGLFQHALVHLYNTKKTEKRNNLYAGIATGMATYNYSYSKSRGSEGHFKTEDELSEYSNKMRNLSKINTLLHHFKYGREQEYQADIVAFRLLDWLGIGGEYFIEMLQLIKDPFEFSTYEYDDHPSIQDRIELLKYMQSQKRKIYYQQ